MSFKAKAPSRSGPEPGYARGQRTWRDLGGRHRQSASLLPLAQSAQPLQDRLGVDLPHAVIGSSRYVEASVSP